MEQTIAQLQFRWTILRAISWTIVIATDFVTVETIPTASQPAAIPILILATAGATLAIIQWKRVWVWLTISTQCFLFVIGLFSAVSGRPTSIEVPTLIVAFPLILASEHVLTTTSRYSQQSSAGKGDSMETFNAHALIASLNHLYMDLGRDSIIFGGAILLSIAVGIASATQINIPLLSDPSLYAIAASLSLVLLIVFREEQEPHKISQAAENHPGRSARLDQRIENELMRRDSHVRVQRSNMAKKF